MVTFFVGATVVVYGVLMKHIVHKVSHASSIHTR